MLSAKVKKIKASLVLVSLYTFVSCVGVISNLTQQDEGVSMAELALLGLASPSEPVGSAVIGPDGGAIRSTDGMLRIQIPPGAVSEEIEFSIAKFEAGAAGLPAGYFPTADAYELTPSYRFQKSVEVSIIMDMALAQSLNLDVDQSLGFSASQTAAEDNSGRFPGWSGHIARVEGDRVIFATQTFSVFGVGTPPPGNQSPVIFGAFYYFKPSCDFTPFRVRAQIVDPDGDALTARLLAGPSGGGVAAFPMAREGLTNWYSANLPYESMSASGIQIQVTATDSFGQNATRPSSGIFQYPADSGVPAYTANYNPDGDGDGLLCAWEADNGYNDNNPADAGPVVDDDGDGIPNISDHTPFGEAVPTIDALALFPADVNMDVGESVSFAVEASSGGQPRYVHAAYVTTGNGLGGSPVGTLSGSVFTANFPGAAGVTAIVGATNAVSTITVADSIGPAPINDLAAVTQSHTRVRLQWTAPGDDGAFGKAAAYEVRRSATAITNDAACSAAAAMAHALSPKNAGLAETLDVDGLTPNTTYYFCVRARDARNNRNLWNGSVVQATTQATSDLTGPAPVTGVAAIATSGATVQLNWNAVGDDNNIGAASAYEIRYSAAPITTDDECSAAAVTPNSVAPAAAGTPRTWTVAGLSGGSQYYFCVRAFDDVNNRSAWSGVASATTPYSNQPPLMHIAPVVPSDAGISVSLDAQASSDPDAATCGAASGSYVYAWTLQSKPPTSTLVTASISNANTLQASLVPDAPGVYTVRLTFTDDPGGCSGGAQFAVADLSFTVLPVWAGTVQSGTAANDSASGAAIDAADNLYVVGYTYGALHGNTSQGDADAFLSKYDRSGQRLWTRQFGTAGEDQALDVALDSSGLPHVTGFVSGDLNGESNAGGRDIFVIKFDANGVAQWTRLRGTTADDEGRGIAVNAGGTVFVTGSTQGNLGGGLGGGTDRFVMAYNYQGTFLDAKNSGTASYEAGYSAAVIGSALYVASAVLAADFDQLISVHTLSGTTLLPFTLYPRTAGGSNDEAFGIIANAANDLVTVGYTRPVGQPDSANQATVARYTSGGASLQWIQSFGSAGDDIATRVALDPVNNIFVTGRAREAIDAQPHAGGNDVFLVRYNQAGARIWARLIGTTGDETGADIVRDSRGALFIVGETSGGLDGNASAGGNDYFIVKFNSSGLLQ